MTLLAATQMPQIPRPIRSSLDWSHLANKSLKVIVVRRQKEDGYRITIRPSKIVIDVNSANELTAWSRLSQIKQTTHQYPTGTIEWKPSISWRGVHLFVGPNALETHKTLWTEVLLPLGFNKVVLQCEQTEWKCIPNIRGGINMKREDLRVLCEWYRHMGVEVIPLVESFGHVQWLSQKGKNLDLMMNPKVPFTVDPRKPKVQALYTSLLNEVLQVTKAKTVHFGLDEVDFRGFPKDPKLVTQLWKIQVPFLMNWAKKHKVVPMLWGDEILAPSEGAGPATAATLEEAKARRAVLPKNAIICDWHYQDRSDPNFFAASLNTLKKEGFRTIASAWDKSNNVRGQVGAAIQTKSGFLLTTWAGYELNEKVIKNNLSQFSASVVASDYLWGNKGKIDYNPSDVFRGLWK